MIDGKVSPKPKKTQIKRHSGGRKKHDGRLCRNYKHLDEVQKGQALAVYENGETLPAPFDGYILLPNHTAEIGAEWYYLGTKKQGL